MKIVLLILLFIIGGSWSYAHDNSEKLESNMQPSNEITLRIDRELNKFPCIKDRILWVRTYQYPYVYGQAEKRLVLVVLTQPSSLSEAAGVYKRSPNDEPVNIIPKSRSAVVLLDIDRSVLILVSCNGYSYFKSRDLISEMLAIISR